MKEITKRLGNLIKTAGVATIQIMQTLEINNSSLEERYESDHSSMEESSNTEDSSMEEGYDADHSSMAQADHSSLEAGSDTIPKILLWTKPSILCSKSALYISKMYTE